ncbi:hypothetical protein NI389_17790 (plasmid) [Pseudoalteromonas xiamenensis]|uniref:hypothetical protein n=1 Tax=Pseudoalteromonas xiamenensis TaxID=882626 RepID=UPI0027E49156|nr:hypothetical protein [Pseudoalteromonas xiamenensis]WMN61666.1 hypothetical protein NI389_17790 [Pseudoalteromonas xiamenensis]
MLTVYFRVSGLTKLQALTFTKEVQDAQCQVQPDLAYSGKAPLTVYSMDDINMFIVRQHVQIEQCEILLNVQHNHSINAFSAPNQLNQMLKHIDCRVTVEVD